MSLRTEFVHLVSGCRMRVPAWPPHFARARGSQAEFVLFPSSRGFCLELVGLPLRAINTPCNMRGDTLILPNMCGAFGGVGEGGRG